MEWTGVVWVWEEVVVGFLDTSFAKQSKPLREGESLMARSPERGFWRWGRSKSGKHNDRYSKGPAPLDRAVRSMTLYAVSSSYFGAFKGKEG